MTTHLFINPGSRVPTTVANTYERAQEYAREWFDHMTVRDGFGDIELIDNHEVYDEGRWRFRFRHLVRCGD